MFPQCIRRFSSISLITVFLFGLASPAYSLTMGSIFEKLKTGDDKQWFRIGLGLRTSYGVTENGADDNGTATGMALDNMRLYTLAKVTKDIVVEFNTELSNGNSTASLDADQTIRVLDAVAKFSLPGDFTMWAGRFLPPSDRFNLDGPYFLNAYNFPIVQAYPALENGRDNGFAIMKEYGGGKFKWSYGLFEGRTSDTNSDTNPDQSDNSLHTFRATYNFWAPEPGYYTTSSYYGAKDVLAVAFVYHKENDGAGTSTTVGDFTGWNVDVLMEKKLSNGGVVNLEGAYFEYDTDDKTDSSLTQGESYLMLASYLLPKAVGVGKLQPYVRYQHFARDGINRAAARGNRSVMEGGINYIISGANGKICAFYSGDKVGNGSTTDSFNIGMQFQLM